MTLNGRYALLQQRCVYGAQKTKKAVLSQRELRDAAVNVDV